MIASALQIVKAQSKAGNNGPWVSHFEEMGKKTTVRRLCKMLPMSIELARAAALDEASDAGRGQGIERVLDGEWTAGDAEDEEAETITSDGEVVTFKINTGKGLIEHPTIGAWEQAWLQAINAEKPDNLKRARELNGALMGEYAGEHAEAVMRVQEALSAKIAAAAPVAGSN